MSTTDSPRARSRETRSTNASLSLQEKTVKTPVYTITSQPLGEKNIPAAQGKPLLARTSDSMIEDKLVDEVTNYYTQYFTEEFEKGADGKYNNKSVSDATPNAKTAKIAVTKTPNYDEEITIVDGDQKDINISTLSALNASEDKESINKRQQNGSNSTSQRSTTSDLEEAGDNDRQPPLPKSTVLLPKMTSQNQGNSVNRDLIYSSNNNGAKDNSQGNNEQVLVVGTSGYRQPLIQPTHSGRFQAEQSDVLSRSRNVINMASTSTFPNIEQSSDLRGEVLSLRGQLRRLQSAVRSANETTDAESVSSNLNRNKANEKSAQAVQSVISQLKSRVARLTEDLAVSKKNEINLEGELRELKVAYNNLKLQHSSLTEEASAWVVSKEALVEERRQHSEELTELHLTVDNLRARNQALERTIEEIHTNDEEVVKDLYEKTHRLEAENESLKSRNREMSDRLLELESQDVETAKIEVENAVKTASLLENAVCDLKRKLEQTKRDHASERDDLLAAIVALEEGQSSEAVSIIRELRQEIVKTRNIAGELARQVTVLGGETNPVYIQWANTDVTQNSVSYSTAAINSAPKNQTGIDTSLRTTNSNNSSNITRNRSNGYVIDNNNNNTNVFGPDLSITTTSVIQPRSQPLRAAMQTCQIMGSTTGNASSPTANALYLSANGEVSDNMNDVMTNSARHNEEDMESWIRRRVQKMYPNSN